MVITNICRRYEYMGDKTHGRIVIDLEEMKASQQKAMYVPFFMYLILYIASLILINRENGSDIVKGKCEFIVLPILNDTMCIPFIMMIFS